VPIPFRINASKLEDRCDAGESKTLLPQAHGLRDRQTEVWAADNWRAR